MPNHLLFFSKMKGQIRYHMTVEAFRCFHFICLAVQSDCTRSYCWISRIQYGGSFTLDIFATAYQKRMLETELTPATIQVYCSYFIQLQDKNISMLISQEVVNKLIKNKMP
jgi:hypothetical protein